MPGTVKLSNYPWVMRPRNLDKTLLANKISNCTGNTYLLPIDKCSSQSISKKFLFPIDPYGKPELAKIQGTIEHVVPSHNWYICNITLTSKAQERPQMRRPESMRGRIWISDAVRNVFCIGQETSSILSPQCGSLNKTWTMTPLVIMPMPMEEIL